MVPWAGQGRRSLRSGLARRRVQAGLRKRLRRPWTRPAPPRRGGGRFFASVLMPTPSLQTESSLPLRAGSLCTSVPRLIPSAAHAPIVWLWFSHVWQRHSLRSMGRRYSAMIASARLRLTGQSALMAPSQAWQEGVKRLRLDRATNPFDTGYVARSPAAKRSGRRPNQILPLSGPLLSQCPSAAAASGPPKRPADLSTSFPARTSETSPLRCRSGWWRLLRRIHPLGSPLGHLPLPLHLYRNQSQQPAIPQLRFSLAPARASLSAFVYASSCGASGLFQICDISEHARAFFFQDSYPFLSILVGLFRNTSALSLHRRVWLGAIDSFTANIDGAVQTAEAGEPQLASYSHLLQ